MNKITKRIRIKKDYYLKGSFSVHITKYVNGEMTYDSVLNYFKRKIDAKRYKLNYKNGKSVMVICPCPTYKEFIKR